MRPRIQSLAPALFAALAACGGGSADSAAPPAPAVVAPGTWVVIGSSSAAGAGATPGRSWAARLQAEFSARPVSLVNLAKGGTTTYAGLSASSAPVSGRPLPDGNANVDAALAQSPRLLLISYPSNDTALGYSVDETVHNLLAMRAAARGRGVVVVMLSTQPRDLSPAQLAALPQIDTRLADAAAPCFVALREAMAGPTGTLDSRFDSGDGVHLNDAGHALVHASVVSLLDAGRCVQPPGR